MKMYNTDREFELHRFDGSTTGIVEMDNWVNTGTWIYQHVRTRDCGREYILRTFNKKMIATAGDYIICCDGVWFVMEEDVTKLFFETE